MPKEELLAHEKVCAAKYDLKNGSRTLVLCKILTFPAQGCVLIYFSSLQNKSASFRNQDRGKRCCKWAEDRSSGSL